MGCYVSFLSSQNYLNNNHFPHLPKWIYFVIRIIINNDISFSSISEHKSMCNMYETISDKNQLFVIIAQNEIAMNDCRSNHFNSKKKKIVVSWITFFVNIKFFFRQYCNFMQGVLLCPQTLSQSRRTRLRRAFTEATSDTMHYVKTVFKQSNNLNYYVTNLQ